MSVYFVLSDITKYAIIACALYSLIMLILSRKLGVTSVISWLCVCLFILSVFAGIRFFRKINTVQYISRNLALQHIVILISLYPLAIVLKKVGLNRKLLFWGRVYMGIVILLLAQRFVTGYDLFFRIAGDKCKTTAWYFILYFCGNSILFCGIVINLLIRLQNEKNRFFKKLIKSLLTGIGALVASGTVDMIVFIIHGQKGVERISLSLPGIIVLSAASFIFITEVIYSRLVRTPGKGLFLQEEDFETINDEEFQQIVRLIKKDKLYMDPDISLINLADSLGINRNELSRIINRNTRNNYNQFINKLRLEAFFEAFSNEANRTVPILELALNYGFNSKATFHRVFRESYQMSPREYRKMNFEK